MGRGRRYTQSHARGPCSYAQGECLGGMLREACLGGILGILGGHAQVASGACSGRYSGRSWGAALGACFRGYSGGIL